MAQLSRISTSKRKHKEMVNNFNCDSLKICFRAECLRSLSVKVLIHQKYYFFEINVFNQNNPDQTLLLCKSTPGIKIKLSSRPQVQNYIFFMSLNIIIPCYSVPWTNNSEVLSGVTGEMIIEIRVYLLRCPFFQQ